jgi:hypothetical protein
MRINLQEDHGEHMTESKPRILERDWVYIVLMTVIVIGFCNRLLFTDMIIRASDVVTQFIWGAKAMKQQPLWDYISNLPGLFRAGWEPLQDGGRTLEGGWNALGLLLHRFLIMHFFPFPSSIAWLAVLSLLWGGIGTFLYCRTIGVGRCGALAAGLLYALCTENASLINAGHIQKIEAISWAPWAIFFLEKSLRSGRFFHYAMTALMLAIQFFTMHWQIAFYTCLAVGAYWFFYVIERFAADAGGYSKLFAKDLLLASAILILFFSTVAMSFAPLLSWSKQSERGGGMSQEAGLSWSMPPEELLSFAIPGLVGYSRQEAGDAPEKDQVYYWGRMHFTQTNDYLGLLPWFLLPLTVIFIRDRYTRFFSFLLVATLLMALGKYTFVYRFMFDHLPGFSTFRVPKMIMFLFAFAAAVLMGRGVDLILSDIDRRRLRLWFAVIAAGVASLWLFRLYAGVSGRTIIGLAGEFIGVPTRYQSGNDLVLQRYTHLVKEAGTAALFASVCLALFFAWFRRWMTGKMLFVLLMAFMAADLWHVNRNFFVLTPPPQSDKKAAKSDVVSFLEPRIGTYRMQPLGGESATYYAEYGLANLSAYVTVSEKRYAEFLDAFSLGGSLPDMVNLKYLVMPEGDYSKQQEKLSGKYTPVFTSASGLIVLENRTVLPKAWLVPSVFTITDSASLLGAMNDPRFDPARIAFVESPPPMVLSPMGSGVVPGTAQVDVYKPNQIVVSATVKDNSLLVLGEKYYKWWYARIDGKPADIVPVNHILRGVYLTPGSHRVEFVFDPLPFKVGKWLTLLSFTLFAVLLGREWLTRRRMGTGGVQDGDETAGVA